MKKLNYIRLWLYKNEEMIDAYESRYFETPEGAETWLQEQAELGRWELDGAWVGNSVMSTAADGAMYVVIFYLKVGSKRHIAVVKECVFSVSD